MKKNLFKIITLLIFIILSVFFFYKLDKYFDAKIKYENIYCNDNAYIIYKQYDDQVIEYKNRDWSLRTEECTKVEAEYKKGI